MSLTAPLRAYDLAPVAARCPACAHGEALRLYATDSREVAQHHVVQERDLARHRELRAHVEALWGQPTCDVLRCARCGFGYPRPYVAGDARFFDLAHQRHAGAYPRWRWEFGRTLEVLRDGTVGLPPAFRLLEVGAGDGAFVRAVTPALTPKERVLTTELSGYAVDALRTYGVECHADDIRALDPTAVGPFDVVAMFHVVQHLVGLDDLFRHLGRLTTAGAHLFMSVPNAARIELSELNGGMKDLPPNHCGRWGRRAFEALGGRHGWGVRDYRTAPRALVPWLAEVAIYRHLRRGQIAGSLTNRVEAVRHRRLRRALQLPMVGAQALGALPFLLRHRDGPGETDWVWLQKRPPRAA